MLKKLLPLVLLSIGCAESGRRADAGGADSSTQDRQRAVPAAAFRVPARGGPLSVYTLPTLQETPWGSGARLGRVRSAVGVDLPGRRLLFRDSVGAVASFDLVSMRQRAIGPRNSTVTIAADGSLLAVDSAGNVTESQPWGTRTWPGSLGRGVRAVFAAPGPRLLAVRRTRGGDSLKLAAREAGVSATQAVPASEAVTASRDGDAVAFLTDSAIVVYEDRALDEPWTIRLEGRPGAVMFSPSGHRIYVALRDKNEMAVVDRFNRELRGSVSLPGPATSLRPDPWGRVILVRGTDETTGEETWVIGVSNHKVNGRLKDRWATDLPTVSQSGVLLSREGEAVVARDVRTLDSLGAVEDGANDLWFAGRWVPTSGAAIARAQAERPAPPPSRRPDEAPRDQPAPPPAPPAAARPPAAPPAAPPPAAPPAAPAATPTFYAQLLATRSEEAARSLAAALAPEPVRVEPPRSGTGDDNWRVLAGPFPSREAADSAGRSLGRPYWVVDRTPGARRP